MENIIEIKNVGVKFSKKRSFLRAKKSNAFWALNDVSFNIKKGEVLGIIGRNGAGKSTLLTLLAGIISPSKGSVSSKTNRISLLSLQAGFVPFLSGRKNIILAGMLLGFSKEEMLNLMDEIVEFSELGTFIDEPVVNYSAGMKTRLGFSTAIIINPSVILIDEVLGVGDASFRKKSEEALREKLGGDTTAVIVSHSEAMVRSICDRVVLISEGKTCYEGSVEEGIAMYNQILNKRKK